ncbi:hypothetical protein G6F16_006409 [Rhizopus arrhizus]|uniref:Uncharacterized protein n=1 Tax=Rhizopus oryzae TaxID=64495 RepID=A0A9P6X4T8_RHIOR|nr:hypothetical protein G6F23_012476 [Rhizopus arrhizus]KAG0772547.1 hypothetical protein G6F22_015653 [Rhizopus arrhizus]KAG0791824.1 hypothetical protein G6F21_004806 [Rhizopus arrhizus]KAG0816425.1 hypothetical protein G6F20_003209 [Rhizopus arrhizus]KAG0838006.1 hypothetical protein G6F19_003376 [Rhizopus arrhizus]
MEYIVDQNEFIVEPIATHSEYLKNMPSSESSSVCPMLTIKKLPTTLLTFKKAPKTLLNTKKQPVLLTLKKISMRMMLKKQPTTTLSATMIEVVSFTRPRPSSATMMPNVNSDNINVNPWIFRGKNITLMFEN